MLRNAIKFVCSGSVESATELLRKCQTLQQQITINNEKLTTLKESFTAEEKKMNVRNKQINELRIQLTSDINKGEDCWKDTQKKSELHKKQSIRNFAIGLTSISRYLKQIKNYEKDPHNLDIKEGFELTSRLFFNTLEKYKISEFEPKLKSKFNNEQMVMEGLIQTENQCDKGTVAKVAQLGYHFENTVIHKAKVYLYN